MNEEQLRNYYTGCKLIIEHYGLDAQKRQLIQELGELIVALTKNNLQNIIEEMADVQVMLDQFTIHDKFIANNFEVYQLQKVKRQLERIKKEKSAPYKAVKQTKNKFMEDIKR